MGRDERHTAASEERAPRIEEAPRATPPVSDAEIAALRARLVMAVARVCPRALVEHREDIVQEAMIRVLKVLDRSSRAPNATYLWKVGYTATIDAIRSARRRAEIVGAEPSPDVADRSPGSCPERVLGSAEIGAHLRDCLATVSERRRRAATLYLLGHGVSDIATLLAIPYKSAENLVLRGLGDVRRCLEGKGVILD
jgi:RNA polymerase sigma-70 factor, ECF subfamily